jgi:hypothetical protein
MNPPQDRTSELLKTDLGEEVVIYDPESKRAHSLNHLAVSVWNHFDAQKSIPELTRVVSADVGRPIDASTIEDALRQLEQAQLLTRRVQEVGGKTLGRREMLRKAGQVGAAAVATPIVASILVPTAAAAASPPPTPFWSFLGTAFYTGAPFPADLIGGPVGNPDTSFVRTTNTGSSTFVGTIGFIAVAGNGAIGTASYAVTLNPGASASISFNAEASNQGGWNGPTGSTQNGAEFVINGTATLGSSQPVAFSIFDKDIHSGVFRTNPFGENLDNYILQGGSSVGSDTGDGYETTQAAGSFPYHS